MGRLSIAEQRRVEIARAFLTCLVKNGSYEGTSVKEIAAQLGTTPSLIYHYFPGGKHEVLMLAADMAIDRVSELMDMLLVDSPDPESLSRFPEKLFADHEMVVFLARLYSISVNLPEMLAHFSDIQQTFEEKLQGKLRESPWFHGNPEDAAEEITFLFTSSMVFSSLGYDERVERVMSRSLKRLFLTDPV